MNATQRLIEASEHLELLFTYEDEGLSYGRPKAHEWREAREELVAALAACKEEQAKVLTDEEIERLADECFGNMLNGIKHRPLADLEQKAAKSTISMYRTALRYARDNGYLAPAKCSGLDVDGAVRAIMEEYDVIRLSSAAHLVEGVVRKALEDLAENGGANLRADPPHNT